jgi:ribosomal protein S18 acetylase RimI-like enzyme
VIRLGARQNRDTHGLSCRPSRLYRPRMTSIIRTGRPEDISEVLAVWTAAEAVPTVSDDADSLKLLIAHDSAALLVAEKDGRIVGTLIATWDGWRAGMWRLAVLPEHRRRGIARRLVERAEELHRRRGARRIATFVVTTGATSGDFWTALGYQAQIERRRFVKNLTAD